MITSHTYIVKRKLCAGKDFRTFDNYNRVRTNFSNLSQGVRDIKKTSKPLKHQIINFVVFKGDGFVWASKLYFIFFLCFLFSLYTFLRQTTSKSIMLQNKETKCLVYESKQFAKIEMECKQFGKFSSKSICEKY